MTFYLLFYSLVFIIVLYQSLTLQPKPSKKPSRDPGNNYPRKHLQSLLICLIIKQDKTTKKMSRMLFLVPPSCRANISKISSKKPFSLQAYPRKCYQNSLFSSQPKKRLSVKPSKLLLKEPSVVPFITRDYRRGDKFNSVVLN